MMERAQQDGDQEGLLAALAGQEGMPGMPGGGMPGMPTNPQEQMAALRELVDSGQLTDDDKREIKKMFAESLGCLLYTSPSPRDQRGSRMPSSA